MLNFQDRALLLSRRVWIMLFMGFASGLPLALTSTTLQAWLTSAGVSIKEIGIFSLVALPYIYKFLWSPLMDRFVPPFLGRRRGWMLITQVGVLICTLLMSLLDPCVSPLLLAILALITAFIAASQDIAIDAYRTDVLHKNELGLGSAMFIGGWRLGAMVSGGIALIIADIWGWHLTYVMLALCMLIAIIATLLAPKPEFDLSPPRDLSQAIVLPFKEFLSRKYALTILLFVLLYKLGDAFALSLISTFLMRGADFSLTTVGSVFKIYGVIATIFGVFLGGYFLSRIKFFPALFIFGLLQACANLAFISLIYIHQNYSLLVTVVSIENITSGMMTAAFMAFLMSLCNHHFTATQYALLSAFAAVGRVLLGPLAGWIAQDYGWVSYYIASFIIAMPSLLLLVYLHKRRLLDEVQRSEAFS